MGMINYRTQITLTVSIFLMSAISHVSIIDIPQTEFRSAFSHQQELMGQKRSPQSLLSQNKVSDMISMIVLDEVKNQLPKNYKKQALKIATAIIVEAEKYKMDPLFILSIIKQESRFNPLAIGSVGEIGLMQIRPSTAKWLNQKNKLVTTLNLKNPVTNIKIGAFFLSTLRNKFDGHGQYYISAYNMGAAKVRQKIKQNSKPKLYVMNVMKHYVEFLNKIPATSENDLELIQSSTPSIAANDFAL